MLVPMGSSGNFLEGFDWRPFCPQCGQEAIASRRATPFHRTHNRHPEVRSAAQLRRQARTSSDERNCARAGMTTPTLTQQKSPRGGFSEFTGSGPPMSVRVAPDLLLGEVQQDGEEHQK